MRIYWEKTPPEVVDGAKASEAIRQLEQKKKALRDNLKDKDLNDLQTKIQTILSSSRPPNIVDDEKKAIIAILEKAQINIKETSIDTSFLKALEAILEAWKVQKKRKRNQIQKDLAGISLSDIKAKVKGKMETKIENQDDFIAVLNAMSGIIDSIGDVETNKTKLKQANLSLEEKEIEALANNMDAMKSVIGVSLLEDFVSEGYTPYFIEGNKIAFANSKTPSKADPILDTINNEKYKNVRASLKQAVIMKNPVFQRQINTAQDVDSENINIQRADIRARGIKNNSYAEIYRRSEGKISEAEVKKAVKDYPAIQTVARTIQNNPQIAQAAQQAAQQMVQPLPRGVNQSSQEEGSKNYVTKGMGWVGDKVINFIGRAPHMGPAPIIGAIFTAFLISKFSPKDSNGDPKFGFWKALLTIGAGGMAVSAYNEMSGDDDEEERQKKQKYHENAVTTTVSDAEVNQSTMNRIPEINNIEQAKSFNTLMLSKVGNENFKALNIYANNNAQTQQLKPTSRTFLGEVKNEQYKGVTSTMVNTDIKSINTRIEKVKTKALQDPNVKDKSDDFDEIYKSLTYTQAQSYAAYFDAGGNWLPGKQDQATQNIVSALEQYADEHPGYATEIWNWVRNSADFLTQGMIFYFVVRFFNGGIEGIAKDIKNGFIIGPTWRFITRTGDIKETYNKSEISKMKFEDARKLLDSAKREQGHINDLKNPVKKHEANRHMNKIIKALVKRLTNLTANSEAIDGIKNLGSIDEIQKSLSEVQKLRDSLSPGGWIGNIYDWSNKYTKQLDAFEKEAYAVIAEQKHITIDRDNMSTDDIKQLIAIDDLKKADIEKVNMDLNKSISENEKDLLDMKEKVENELKASDINEPENATKKAELEKIKTDIDTKLGLDADGLPTIGYRVVENNAVRLFDPFNDYGKKFDINRDISALDVSNSDDKDIIEKQKAAHEEYETQLKQRKKFMENNLPADGTPERRAYDARIGEIDAEIDNQNTKITEIGTKLKGGIDVKERARLAGEISKFDRQIEIQFKIDLVHAKDADYPTIDKEYQNFTRGGGMESADYEELHNRIEMDKRKGTTSEGESKVIEKFLAEKYDGIIDKKRLNVLANESDLIEMLKRIKKNAVKMSFNGNFSAEKGNIFDILKDITLKDIKITR